MRVAWVQNACATYLVMSLRRQVCKARDSAAAGRARTGACAAARRMHVCSWAAGPMRSFSFRSVNQQEERLLPGMLAS